jgi:hypothetical protein
MVENDCQFEEKYVADYLDAIPFTVRHMIPLWCEIYGTLNLSSIEYTDRISPTTKIIKCKTCDNKIVKFNYQGIAMVEINGKDYKLSEDSSEDVKLYLSKEKRKWSEIYKHQYRAKKGHTYFYINDCGFVCQKEEQLLPSDSCRWLFGNYFISASEAEKSNIYKVFHMNG